MLAHLKLCLTFWDSYPRFKVPFQKHKSGQKAQSVIILLFVLFRFQSPQFYCFCIVLFLLFGFCGNEWVEGWVASLPNPNSLLSRYPTSSSSRLLFSLCNWDYILLFQFMPTCVTILCQSGSQCFNNYIVCFPALKVFVSAQKMQMFDKVFLHLSSAATHPNLKCSWRRQMFPKKQREESIQSF